MHVRCRLIIRSARLLTLLAYVIYYTAQKYRPKKPIHPDTGDMEEFVGDTINAEVII